MPIRVNCPQCGKPFSAWDDLVGKSVQCPKCKHTMILGGDHPQLGSSTQAPKASSGPAAGLRPAAPSVNPSRPPASPSGPAAGKRPSGGGAPTGAPTGTSAAPRKVVPPAPGSGARSPLSPALPPLPRPGVPAPGRGPQLTSQPRSNVPPPPDFGGDESLPLGCPKCNAPMKPHDDLCDACGYHLVLKKVIDISDMKKRSNATGFERMLEGQLNDAESAGATLIWIKLVACFLLLGCCVICLGRWWWLGVLGAGSAGAYFWMRSRGAARSDATGSAVNQDPVSRLIWSLVLSLQRVAGWRRPEWPFPKARSLTLWDPQLTDDELAEWEGLSELEAIDLESSGITDESLEHLRQANSLRFLVLRGTQVTPAGVARLQADLPQLYVWS
ncbi:MAG: hypothetical protein AB7F89_10340 [Pirellulaceae bacterium]